MIIANMLLFPCPEHSGMSCLLTILQGGQLFGKYFQWLGVIGCVQFFSAVLKENYLDLMGLGEEIRIQIACKTRANGLASGKVHYNAHGKDLHIQPTDLGSNKIEVI